MVLVLITETGTCSFDELLLRLLVSLLACGSAFVSHSYCCLIFAMQKDKQLTIWKALFM
jgi:hypothetical protein